VKTLSVSSTLRRRGAGSVGVETGINVANGKVGGLSALLAEVLAVLTWRTAVTLRVTIEASEGTGEAVAPEMRRAGPGPGEGALAVEVFCSTVTGPVRRETMTGDEERLMRLTRVVEETTGLR